MKKFDIINFKNHMAMKKYLITLVCVAGATALFTACTSESGGPSTSISYEQVKAAEQVPVNFGTYWGEQAITRSGYAKNMTLTALQANSFGVFAYHTPENGSGKYLYWNTATAVNDATKLAADYPSATAANFMFNQKVTYGTDWGYTPIKSKTSRNSRTALPSPSPTIPPMAAVLCCSCRRLA